ncbi:hypothetical protein [Streptomyces kronopolitis]|uniref:hypothetical protein n=1 Tax=Streptomyces kronopolitis TaxID=1612435 RepID=UPI0036B77E1F
MRLQYDRLLAFAAFLDLPLDRLTGAAANGTALVDTDGCPSGEEDAVRRRNLRTEALTAGATTVFGDPSASVASMVRDSTAYL